MRFMTEHTDKYINKQNCPGLCRPVCVGVSLVIAKWPLFSARCSSTQQHQIDMSFCSTRQELDHEVHVQILRPPDGAGSGEYRERLDSAGAAHQLSRVGGPRLGRDGRRLRQVLLISGKWWWDSMQTSCEWSPIYSTTNVGTREDTQ